MTLVLLVKRPSLITSKFKGQKHTRCFKSSATNSAAITRQLPTTVTDPNCSSRLSLHAITLLDQEMCPTLQLPGIHNVYLPR